MLYIINKTFASSLIPEKFKYGFVSPIFRKKGIHGLTEKCIHNQVSEFWEERNLLSYLLGWPLKLKKKSRTIQEHFKNKILVFKDKNRKFKPLKLNIKVVQYTLRELIFAGTNFRGFFFKEISREKKELIFADQVSSEISRELIFADEPY